MSKNTLFVLSIIMLTLNICGCGGGSGSAATSQKTVQSSTVQGVAAAGNPISGTIYLKGLSIFQNYTTVSAKTTAAGEFSIDTTGLKPPFLLKTTDSSSNTLFSYANGPGTVNINPLTTVAVAVAAGATDSNSLTALYDSYNQNHDAAYDITKAADSTRSSLQELLGKYDAEKTDFMSGPYAANHQGLDDLFDKVAFTIKDGNVAITRKDNNATEIFRANLSDLLVSDQSANLVEKSIPAPTQYGTPGNAALTLKVLGDLPQGTLIKNASFSVKLPLGVTVVTIDSLLQTGPTVADTTIPMVAGVYSSATLSPTNDILTVTMSSATGFGTGDFLTIIYADSSSYFMHKRTPADFAISSSVFFSDIYKSQKLQNLTIAPDSIAYP